MKKIFFITFFLITGCINKSNIVQKFPEDQELKRKQYAGNLFGNKDGIVIFDDKNNNTDSKKIENNRSKNILWNKSISIISNILPISILDENSGLITTDWGSIKEISKNDSLYKINIIIKGNEIKEENLVISVFKKDKNNTNIKDNIILNKIKNLILN